MSLNPAQSEAAHHIYGPLLILAGAGSGKTRVLTVRMANLIESGHASPEEILAVTFTNKAAREMESRIYSLLSQKQIAVRAPLWVSTFHSFCVRFLRNHIELAGYKPNFTVYDDSDQLSMVKKALKAFNLDEKLYPPKSYRSRINNAKNLGLGCEKVAQHRVFSIDRKFVEVYTQYEQLMKLAQGLDFGDLLLKTYEILADHPNLLQQYQEHFKFVMVDEYQDTNHVQYLLIRLLAGGHGNLCVVGDEDQSIYGWRGADIRNILDFEKDFPNAKIVKLEENYRSTKNIVSAATALIRNNSQRKDKTLFTSNPSGEPIVVREEATEYDEARYVAVNISQLLNSGEATAGEIAVFYRTNAQSRVLEEQLRMSSIAYRIVGGLKFYDRAEVKDLVAYLKLIANPDDDSALKRIINVPARGIGKTTLEKIDEASLRQRVSLSQALRLCSESGEFNSGTRAKLKGFVDLHESMIKFSSEHNLNDLYAHLVFSTGYAKMLQLEKTEESEARLRNLEELGNALQKFTEERGVEASLQNFLEEMALVSDADALTESFEAVTLMTLHVSKGLEFPYVFIVGLEEDLFPSQRNDEDVESEVEEERRLAYVGITRARRRLWLLHVRMRRIWGREELRRPSRFLNEIPIELLDRGSGFFVGARVSHFAKSSRIFGGENPMVRGGGGSSGSGLIKEVTSKHGDSPKSRDSEDNFHQSFPDYDSNSGSGFGESSGAGVGAGQDSGFQKGQRVKHPTFGVGTVYELEGSGDQTKVGVVFMDKSVKKFVVKYARLEILR